MIEEKIMDDKQEKLWKDFQGSGMLWFVNRILHTFGWAIVFEVDDFEVDDSEMKIVKVYPQQVKYYGFGREVEEEGYKKVSQFMSKNADSLAKRFDKE